MIPLPIPEMGLKGGNSESSAYLDSFQDFTDKGVFNGGNLTQGINPIILVGIGLISYLIIKKVL